jgi:hypothetical protein
LIRRARLLSVAPGFALMMVGRGWIMEQVLLDRCGLGVGVGNGGN